MAQWDEVQRSFIGGEIGARMLMRDDLAVHQTALLEMVNYIPTPQGTAVRTPGTRYIYTVADTIARIIPFLAPDNTRSMVEITAAGMTIVQNLGAALSPNTATTRADLRAVTPIYRQIKDNAFFNNGFDGWDADPLYVPGVNDEDAVGWTDESPSSLLGTCQLYTQGNPDYLTLKGECVVPADTTVVQIDLLFQYLHNFSSPEATYDCKFRVGTTEGGQEVWVLDRSNLSVADGLYDKVVSIQANLAAGTTLYLSLDIKATASPNNPYSTPRFRISRWRIFTQDTVDIEDGPVTGTVPWSEDELPDVQYVQSPYQGPVGGLGKELVFTHPNHPPYELVFLGAAWTLREKPFVNPPAAWTPGNYPACCASFHGRLMLAGSQNNPELGSATGSATETVWGTRVSDWNTFSPDEEVDPDDSIEFTTIYRSPIQWLYGQKDLLIGALEMEYMASADGIFQPADLGVFMQSTHGSKNVQPAGMGDMVLFPADGGTKVRGMAADTQKQGWISPDLTLLHPGLFAQGIVRMVRMRNPFQLLIVVMATGQVSLLHLDSDNKIAAWSRMNFNANVKDACVIADEDGRDTLLFTVLRRDSSGAEVLRVEAIANWVENVDWAYLNSHSSLTLDSEGNILTGLDHLEGQIVQVVGDGNYLGYFTVAGGQVELINDIGMPIYVVEAQVGLPILARMRTLPLITKSPDSLKRYPKLYVRSLAGTRPIVNGERAADRDPNTQQGYSQPPDILWDHEGLQLGWDSTQVVTIEENTPVRSEIVGIFGKVKTGDL